MRHEISAATQEERNIYGIGDTDLAIVVLSCDRYSDLWPAFFYCLRKYWPKCPFPTYLFANEKPCETTFGVKTVLSGRDTDWSSSIKACLEQLEHEYVLVLFDDVFLNTNVEPADFAPLLRWLTRTKPAYLRFRPVPSPDERVTKDIGRYCESTLYRAAVFSIWRRNVFVNILVSGESAWSFETNASKRSVVYSGFYGSYRRNPLSYSHGVEKGMWLPSTLKWLTDIGAPITMPGRSIMSARDVALSRFAHFREFFFNHAPATLRPHLWRASRFVRRILIS